MKKLKIIICMLVVFTGIFLIFGGAGVSVPKSVTVNGISVGGLPYAKAAEKVRTSTENFLKGKYLEIRAGSNVYKFTFPEIYYKDNVSTVLKSAKKGDVLTAETKYYLCGLDEIAADICRNESVDASEPYAKFSRFGKPFTYFDGSDGKRADIDKLRKDVKLSLNGGFEPVEVGFTPVKRRQKIEDVKKTTRLIARFSTCFDSSNFNRVSNIRLAASKLNGCIIGAGETLSFNDIVGARIKERGFLPAKIIENGEFTEGVGGGVCQVSTTLYNAALLAGMKIDEYHPHSLAVSYVPPSRDAMVNGSVCDLKIKNPFGFTLYLRASVGNGSISFEVYGANDGASYSLSSEVTGAIIAPEEFTDDPSKEKAGKDGLTSRAYLTITRGSYKKVVVLRNDKYKPVKKVVLQESAEQESGEDKTSF